MQTNWVASMKSRTSTKDFHRTSIEHKSYCQTSAQHQVRCCPFFSFGANQYRKKKWFYFCFRSLIDSDKKPALKTFEEIQTLLSQGKKREVKLLIRDNAWPINSTIRSQLWPAVCSQHQVGKSMLEGYYWDMVNQASTNEWKKRKHNMIQIDFERFVFDFVAGVRNDRIAGKANYVAAIRWFHTLFAVLFDTQRTSGRRSSR